MTTSKTGYVALFRSKLQSGRERMHGVPVVRFDAEGEAMVVIPGKSRLGRVSEYPGQFDGLQEAPSAYTVIPAAPGWRARIKYPRETVVMPVLAWTFADDGGWGYPIVPEHFNGLLSSTGEDPAPTVLLGPDDADDAYPPADSGGGSA